jgi:outer membrane immunogenic protein
MNRLATCVAVIAALIIGAPAFAADMAVKAPPPPLPVAAPWSWAGFYGGVSVGARIADNDWTSSNFFPTVASTIGGITQPVTGGSVDSVAPRIGAYGGYSWLIAPAWLLGIEGDVGWANNSKTVTPAPGTAGIVGLGMQLTGQPSGTVKETWDGSLRARLGSLIAPSTLVFATGGAAWQSITLASSCGLNGPFPFCNFNNNDSASTVRWGWTVGAGVEQRISGNWLVRVDYRYADFGTFSHQFFPAAFGPGSPIGFDDRYTGTVKARTNTIDVGLAYKF